MFGTIPNLNIYMIEAYRKAVTEFWTKTLVCENNVTSIGGSPDQLCSSQFGQHLGVV